MKNLTVVGTKKAVEPKILNSETLPSAKRQGNIDQVAAGVCPHEGSALSLPIPTKGSGEKATCSKCGHTWYINKKIRTCKCLTCSAAKEKPQVKKLAECCGIARKMADTRVSDNSMTGRSGGPLWSRTTDLSLIRNDASVNLLDYVGEWYSEQRLRGLVETTISGYRQKVEALLGEHPKPAEIDIKRYLAKKQEFGACSGTIANYVKAYRSFFCYLFERGLCQFDPRCLKLPRIRHKERRVPSDEDVSKLLSVVQNQEDKVALLLLVDTGIRITELASIKLKNIDLDDASIVVNGKSGKTRVVYLSGSTIDHLRGYMQTLSSEYLFPSTRIDAKSEYRNRTFFEKRLRELCKQVGIDRIAPHQLRHYFATHTLSRGGDVKAVSQMLGHADVGITLKIYHHVNAKSIQQMHQEYSPLIRLTVCPLQVL